MPLSVIRRLYPDAAAFVRGISGLLSCGDIRLLSGPDEVSRWKWRGILDASDFAGLTLSITQQGASRVS